LFRKSNDVRKYLAMRKLTIGVNNGKHCARKEWRQKRLSRTYKDNLGILNSTWQIHDEATRDEVQFLRFFDSMVDLDKFRGQGKAFGQILCNFPKCAKVERAICTFNEEQVRDQGRSLSTREHTGAPGWADYD
jgi:hypothetical protein